jgi:hypothetical protein
MLEKIKEYLDSLEHVNFVESKIENIFIGSVDGEFVSLLVIEGNRKPSAKERAYQQNVLNANGSAFTVRSLSDVCLLSKEEGWHD